MRERRTGPTPLPQSSAASSRRRLSRDFYLVLDDVHLLGKGGDAVRLIAALCRNAPERLHVVTASREMLPFPTSRMRVQGQAWGDPLSDQLAFTIDEVGSSWCTGRSARMAPKLHGGSSSEPAGGRWPSSWLCRSSIRASKRCLLAPQERCECSSSIWLTRSSARRLRRHSLSLRKAAHLPWVIRTWRPVSRWETRPPTGSTRTGEVST